MSSHVAPRTLAQHPHDHLPAGVFDVHGNELSHRHVREFHAHLLGPHVMDLCELAQAHADDPSHRVHDMLHDAVHSRMSGLWRLEKYDEPIEWHAYRLANNLSPMVAISDKDLDGFDFHAQPESVRVAADAAMKRGKRPLVEEWREQEFENLFLNTGINALWNLSIAAGTTSAGGAVSGYPYLSNAQTRIAVGDSSTAAAATQTWLQASTNKLAVLMDATYPVLSGGGGTSTTFTTQTFRMTATSSLGNFAWAEFCVDAGGNTSSNTTGTNSSTLAASYALDRVVSSQGTKASGQTWQPSLALTIS